MDRHDPHWILGVKRDRLWYKPFSAWFYFNDLAFDIGIRLFWYEWSYSRFRQ